MKHEVKKHGSTAPFAFSTGNQGTISVMNELTKECVKGVRHHYSGFNVKPCRLPYILSSFALKYK
jgi:hypothetical protein